MGKRLYSDDDRRRCVDLFKSEQYTISELSKITGMSYKTVRDCLDSALGENETRAAIKKVLRNRRKDADLFNVRDKTALWRDYMGYQSGEYRKEDVMTLSEVAKKYKISVTRADRYICEVSEIKIQNAVLSAKRWKKR